MRKRRIRIVGAVLIGLGVLVAAPSAYSLTRTAVKTVTDVFVTNDASNPVPATIVGQPTVTISGTPSVQVVQTPFQEFVAAQTTGGEQCHSVDVPSGKTLTITSFSADVEAVANRTPDVYLLTTVHQTNGANFVRSLHLVLHQSNANSWSGDVQTTLYSGSASDPNGNTFSYDACIVASDSQGSFFASFRGFVSGTLS
jgi:hypothetical protein